MMEDRLLKKIMSRTYLVGVVLGVFAFVLIGKLLYINTVQGEHYQLIAKERTVKNVRLEPSRGNVYADDGSILATSVPRYELRWDGKVPTTTLYEQHRKELAQGLSEILKQPKEALLKKLDGAKMQQNRYLLIAKNLTYSQFKKIKALPLFNLPIYKGGLIVEQQIIREHPLGKVAERTVGYEMQDRDGSYLRVGLEGAYSQYLRGDEGRRLKQKIANGQWKPINDSNEKEPTEGFDIYTTLNINIQDVAHNALLAQLEEYEADHGTVVVMETQTGAIKAIANLGRTSEGTYYEKLNYAVGEAHEPGSTFKLMAMVAALEDDVIREDDLIETGNGELKFFGKYKVKDSKKGGYGTLTAAKVFEVSSNTGMVKIITENYRDNPQKFVDRLYHMGLDKPLKIDIKGEANPKIPYPTDADWDGLDLPWMAYGYGVAITPLQTLAFYNAIANDGVMVKPQFINKISNLGVAPEQTFKPQILNPSICSKSTVQKVKTMMFNVVDKSWGTANGIKDDQLTMAGKTGTCQVDYTTDQVQYVSSFVGYFPAEQPKYSCIVVIHRPNKKKGYYGATVAAPVFKTIAKKIYNNTPIEVSVSADAIVATAEEVPLPATEDQQMPNLKGLDPRAAIQLLEGLGIQVELIGTGKVKAQSIKPGTQLQQIDKITLELS
jgi:cell division protein FtsI (penicillin-binding protein 3)